MAVGIIFVNLIVHQTGYSTTLLTVKLIISSVNQLNKRSFNALTILTGQRQLYSPVATVLFLFFHSYFSIAYGPAKKSKKHQNRLEVQATQSGL
jgi:hypothetical protein